MSFYSPTSLCTPAHTLAQSFQPQPSTSEYFTQSTNTTATLSDPQAQLLERWRSLGSYASSERMSWKTVVALNRKLDEVESILGGPAVEQARDRGKRHELGLGITKETKIEKPLEALGEVTPPASEELGRRSSSAVEDHTVNSDLSLLGRFTQATKQLRQRQQEFQVCEVKCSCCNQCILTS